MDVPDIDSGDDHVHVYLMLCRTEWLTGCMSFECTISELPQYRESQLPSSTTGPGGGQPTIPRIVVSMPSTREADIAIPPLSSTRQSRL